MEGKPRTFAPLADAFDLSGLYWYVPVAESSEGLGAPWQGHQ